MNAKVKRRARSIQPGAMRSSRETSRFEAAPLAPLARPKGCRFSTSMTENAGERLDRFLGQAAAGRAHRSVAHPAQGADRGGRRAESTKASRTILRRGWPLGRASPSRRRRRRNRPSSARTSSSAVVYEDEHLIVIDKPAGLVVHPAPGHAAGTLVNALIRHCGASLSGVGGVKRPGIVHRLDKDTSGLLVVAKTDAAHRGLAELFADHGRTGSLEREYLALVWGGFDVTAGKVAAADRPRSAPSGENGRRERAARTPRYDPLAT